MKITVGQKELAAALATANSIVQSKVTIPVLSYVKIDAQNGTASMSASDLAMNSIAGFPILGHTANGAFLFPAKRGTDLVNAFTEPITLEQEGDGPLLVKCGKYKGKLPSTPVTLFPAIESTPPAKFTMNLPVFQNLLSRVEAASPAKEGRHSVPVLQLDSDGKRLRAAATDGFRIAVADVPGDFGVFTLIIPKNTISQLMALKGETVTFAESETNYFYTVAGSVLLTRRSSAKFPPYEKAFQAGPFKGSIVLHTEALKMALARLAPLAGEDQSMYIEITGAGEVTVSTLSMDGSSEETLDVKASGVSGKVKLNPQFISDFLAHASGDITVEFISEKSLVKFTTLDGFTYFVMPKVDAPKETPAPKEQA